MLKFLFVFALFPFAYPLQFIGVNEAGAEFGSNIPGTYGTDYIYPSTSSIDYFVSKGMNIFRVPFLWERMQPTLNAPLSATELGYLDATVNYITQTKGVYCLIDPHNYARYNGQIIGDGVAVSAFAYFWSLLASHYKGNSKVIFGLMNEPHDMVTETWRDDANAAIVAIRATGATNLITVPGNAWTGAWTWTTTNSYGTANAVAMLNITDSGNNFIYEVHQYLDQDGSGTSSTCVSSSIGSQRLESFTAWCRTYGKRAILGEFAGANNPTCAAAVADMLSYMQQNSDVWAGWTWWAAGPWWGSYMFSIEPGAGDTSQPQMSTLQSFIQITPLTSQNSQQTVTSGAGTSQGTSSTQSTSAQSTSTQHPSSLSNSPQSTSTLSTQSTSAQSVSSQSNSPQSTSTTSTQSTSPQSTSSTHSSNVPSSQPVPSLYLSTQSSQVDTSNNSTIPGEINLDEISSAHTNSNIIAIGVGVAVAIVAVIVVVVVALLVMRRRGMLPRGNSSLSLMSSIQSLSRQNSLGNNSPAKTEAATTAPEDIQVVSAPIRNAKPLPTPPAHPFPYRSENMGPIPMVNRPLPVPPAHPPPNKSVRHPPNFQKRAERPLPSLGRNQL